jgi:SAM-dependent methyltransferase
MRRRLLDLLLCPRCRAPFALEVFHEETVPTAAIGAVACDTTCAFTGKNPARDVTRSDCTACHAADVVDGALTCTACRARYPIIKGVPRLLAPVLLARMRRRYPAFFEAHPEFLPVVHDGGDGLGDTLESFTRQRLDLRPPGPEMAQQWRQNLERNLGRALRIEELRDTRVLDIGSGFGRHLYVASQAGAECVGLDLSGGVDVARANNRGHPRCHLIQGNALERPLRDGSFDVVWSFGVLHHMPDPEAGFRALVPFSRPDGGLVVIWVYGYRGMAFTYKLSHMRPLHRMTRTMTDQGRVAASKAVAAALSGLYWGPLRVARRLGLGTLVRRLPLADYSDHDWMARVAAVHDRLSTPITHFHDRNELLGWFRHAGLAHALVVDTDRRGWHASGRRESTAAAAERVA